MTNPTYQMSVDSRLIYQELVKATVGQTFTYATLSNIIARTVTSSSGSLRTAMKRALKDKGFVFGTMRTIGIKRLADIEIVDQSTDTSSRIRKMSRRAVEKLTKVEFEKLPREKQGEHSARVSIMATIGYMTNEKQFGKIRDAADKAGHELPIAATLNLFAS